VKSRHLKDYNELYDLMLKVGTNFDFDMVKKAFELCVTAHEGQKRLSKEDYY
jgi:(p)ppGpp synthase/HD superfamily hydrolase